MSERPKLGLTTARQAVVAVLAGAALCGLILLAFEAAGGFPPVVPWSVPILLVLLAGAVLIYRRTLPKRREEHKVGPQEGLAAVAIANWGFTLDPVAGPARFGNEVKNQIEAMNGELMKIVHSLTPIQSAVLRVMASQGESFAPFEAATLEMYKRALVIAGVAESEARADVPNVQAALSALQEKKLVWRAARGVYSLEEQAMAETLQRSGMLSGLS